MGKRLIPLLALFIGIYYQALAQVSEQPEYRFRQILWRAEAASLGLQVAGFGVLAALPDDVSGWKFNNVKENYRFAYTHLPQWDEDEWYFNLLGHPLTGALHYNIFRSQGGKWWQAFLYSTAQSIIWEYTMEAAVEHPSAQDLIITSNAGSLLGEFFHWSTLKMRKDGFRNWEKITVIIINPMYVLFNGFKERPEKKAYGRFQQF